MRTFLEKTKEFMAFFKGDKRIDYTSFTFVIIIVYLTFLNLFVIRSTPEIIALEFGIIIFVFKKIRFKEFARFWVPFLGLFFAFEFIRGFADDLAPLGERTLLWVYEAENYIFNGLPTLKLQHLLGSSKALLNISVFFYSIFFYFSFLTAFILWLKNEKLFKLYVKGFLLLTFLGLTFFFLIPTAPPWMVELEKHLGIARYLYTEDTILKDVIGITFWNYLVLGNQVAALPSLHTAWPAFTTHFLVRHTKSKWRYLLFIIPAMIAFSVVWTGEHYVIDIVAGWGLAYLAVYISSKQRK